MTVQARRCTHCQRTVLPTMHGRTGASVDFYLTMTGVPRVERFENPRLPGVSVQVLRVDEIFGVVTCRDCWQDPGVQSALADVRRSGVLSQT